MTAKIQVTEAPDVPGGDYAVLEAEVPHVLVEQSAEEMQGWDYALFVRGELDRKTTLSANLGQYKVTIMPGTITLAAIAIFEERRDRQKGNAQHAARWPDLSAKRQANYRAEARAALEAAGAL